MRKIMVAICAALMAMAFPAYADEQQQEGGFGFLVTAGLTVGGDKLAEVDYEHGDGRDVEAGGFILLGAGVRYQFANNWELQTTINYHFDRADADNGDVEFERFPLDGLVFYRTGNHRFGGGITYHMNPSYSVDLDAINGDIDFDDAMGVVVEYDYFVVSNLSVGVRYTSIEYDASGFDDTVDGSHIGVMLNFFF